MQAHVKILLRLWWLEVAPVVPLLKSAKSLWFVERSFHMAWISEQPKKFSFAIFSCKRYCTGYRYALIQFCRSSTESLLNDGQWRGSQACLTPVIIVIFCGFSISLSSKGRILLLMQLSSSPSKYHLNTVQYWPNNIEQEFNTSCSIKRIFQG